MRLKSPLFYLLTGLLLLVIAPVSAAPSSVLLDGILQDPTTQANPTAQSLDFVALSTEIKAKLEARTAELAQLPAEMAKDPTADNLADNTSVYSRRLKLRQLVFLYQGQLSRLANLQRNHERYLEQQAQTANWAGFSETTTHPFLRADELRGTVTSLGHRIDELELWLPKIGQEEAQVVKAAEESTVNLRQADEAVEQAVKASGDQQGELDRGRDILILQNQIDLARAMGFQIEKQAIQEDLQANQAKLELAKKQLGLASEHSEFSQQDLDQVLKNIELESQNIIAELKQLDSSESPTKEAQTANPSALILAKQDTTDTKRQALNRMLVYLQMQRDIWNLRLLYSKVTDREKAAVAYEKITQNQAVLDAVHDYISQLRHHLLADVTRSTVQEIDPTIIGPENVGISLRNLGLEQVVYYSRLMGIIESTKNLLDRCQQELDERFQVKTVADYLAEGLQASKEFMAQIWQFELFAVDDSIVVDGQTISGKRSITVSKTLTALAILIVGFWFAVRVAHLFERLFVTRLSMEPSLARIARRWILFIEVILLVVASMMVVRIPLTIFAFMGGALAIGTGFGMQNMLKNLISGLMLLFERPFRPGDLVEVGGIRGRVIDIGVRSSHIRDGNGIETLIPNSTFIEQNVTNWTLSNQSVRIVVKIGVAYGSPVKEVTDLLLEVADRHGLVEKDPKPLVQFEDFGDNALIFGLYVWVELKPEVSWTVVTSDLRYMINKTLAEHNICMAFAQRDIHIDTSEPLEIRVVNNDDSDSL
ncbi:MAG: mechanosensitive ion channel [Methylococcales bacterium]|nr:mechanosensitive ion channel [Methylococcales bacterium]